LQGFEIETAHDAGIGPKAAHELAMYKLVVHLISVTLFVITKIIYGQATTGDGQARSMLMYFQDKIADNPSFQYAL
jgi:zinc finger SWIM domain-containing protein 3